MKHLIAGDLIVDWIIGEKLVQPTLGGVGNIVRGLKKFGHDIELLTLYNPMLFPVSYTVDLHPNSLTDFNHRNVFIRDYEEGVFQRFRENLKSSVLDVYDAYAVICHEDSVIRRFNSFYADVRDTSVKGTCEILRMSSSDDFMEIMKKVDFHRALVTSKDSVDIYDSLGNAIETIMFKEVEAVDDIGAGDTFDVGFLNCMIKHEGMVELEEAIHEGISLAQEKVQKVGVFHDEEI